LERDGEAGARFNEPDFQVSISVKSRVKALRSSEQKKVTSRKNFLKYKKPYYADFYFVKKIHDWNIRFTIFPCS
jgi:hypothetical protein